MSPCPHCNLKPAAELHDDLHYEEMRCRACGAVIYGPCHHRSMCRLDFCGLPSSVGAEELKEPVTT